jgi:hypothetical protein
VQLYDQISIATPIILRKKGKDKAGHRAPGKHPKKPIKAVPQRLDGSQWSVADYLSSGQEKRRRLRTSSCSAVPDKEVLGSGVDEMATIGGVASDAAEKSGGTFWWVGFGSIVCILLAIMCGAVVQTGNTTQLQLVTEISSFMHW